MALQFTEREFIPVLLGGDINAYSVARAFYEEYQVKSLVFGKYQTGPAYRSQIIDYTPNVDIDTMPVMLKTVNGIAQAHADQDYCPCGLRRQLCRSRGSSQGCS